MCRYEHFDAGEAIGAEILGKLIIHSAPANQNLIILESLREQRVAGMLRVWQKDLTLKPR